MPADSPFCADLREVREVAQATLEKIRNLSQLLHPSILDDGGLEKAIDWYLPVFEKQTGIKVRYEKNGSWLRQSRTGSPFTFTAYCRKR